MEGGGAHPDTGGGACSDLFPVLAPGRGGRFGRAVDQPLLQQFGEKLAEAVGAGGVLGGLPGAGRPETARPFTPWSGELAGETALLRDGVLSLRFQGCEVRGDGRPARVRWGDVWTVREGAPKLLRSLFRGEKGWKGRLWRAIVRQGEERRRAGDCFLDGDWPQKAKKARPLQGWCLTEEGVEVALPQCAAAPAVEGCPVFILPLEEKKAP